MFSLCVLITYIYLNLVLSLKILRLHIFFLMRLFKVAAGKPIWATIHSSRVILERPAEIFRRLFSSFIGGGRPQVPLRALFQARAGTWVEPPTFRKPA
jgi:hypothetical protein